MSYCSESHRGSQAQESEMGTDPVPQNMFWGFIKNFIYGTYVC